eukprot:2946564-Alexandrium_andersonii.AAC.1
MSASLVGSEMCIRDRSKFVPSRPTEPPSLLQGCSFAGGAETGDLGCGRTVSYTHLTLPTICSV